MKPGLVVAFAGSTLIAVGFLSALSSGMVTGNWWPLVTVLTALVCLAAGGWLAREWKREDIAILRAELADACAENKDLREGLRHERQKAKNLSAQVLDLSVDGEPLTSWESIAFLELQRDLGGAS